MFKSRCFLLGDIVEKFSKYRQRVGPAWARNTFLYIKARELIPI